MALIALGWLKGLGLALASHFAGRIVGSIGREREAHVGPTLQRAASVVRARAREFLTAGDLERAEAADDFAARIDAFAEAYSSVSPVAFADYETAEYVAALLDSFYLHPLTSHEDDSDLDLPRWLEREIRPLSAHPVEQARVKLLEGIRQELLAGGGANFRPRSRVWDMVMELLRPGRAARAARRLPPRVAPL